MSIAKNDVCCVCACFFWGGCTIKAFRRKSRSHIETIGTLTSLLCDFSLIDFCLLRVFYSVELSQVQVDEVRGKRRESTQLEAITAVNDVTITLPINLLRFW